MQESIHGSDILSNILLEEYYYRSDYDEYKGVFYWIYQFANGKYLAKTYTDYGQPLLYMEDGEYHINGSEITMDPRGHIPFISKNYVNLPASYSYTLVMENGILVDDKENEYYPGNTKIRSFHAVAIPLAFNFVLKNAVQERTQNQ